MTGTVGVDAHIEVSSNRPLEMRSDQLHRRKESPMYWDNSVCTKDRPNPASLPQGGGRLAGVTARISSEPGARTMGWFPDIGTRGGAQRPRRGSGRQRTVDYYLGSARAPYRHLLMDTVPPPATEAEARRRIRALWSARMPIEVVADAVGMSVDLLAPAYTRSPRAEQLDTDMIVCLSAIAFHPLLDSRPVVPAAGIVRRLRALVAHGIAVRSIALALAEADHRQVALDETELERYVRAVDLLIGWSDSRTTATTPLPRSMWFAVVDVYDALSMRVDMIDHSVRTRAAALAWAAPLEWDESEIDDPLARSRTAATAVRYVDRTAIERRLAGDRTVSLTELEQSHLLAVAIEQRWSADLLADVLGSTKAAATKRKERMMRRRRETERKSA